MSRSKIVLSNSSEFFTCSSCHRVVPPLESGGKNRNHCPYCLSSLHLDLRPGDRRSSCRGRMAAVGIWVQPNKEWSLLHRCERCGFIRATRIAADDDELALLGIAILPLRNVPFPMVAAQQLLQGTANGGDEAAAEHD